MQTSAFSHLQLFVDPIKTLAFFTLMISIVSLWIKKTPWLWGTFILISLILAYDSSIIQPIALVPLLLLFILCAILKKSISGLSRLIVVGTVFLTASALMLHLLPGFKNWPLATNVQISTNGIPYSLWFNFDKPFAGLFILIWCLPLIHTAKQWKRFFTVSLPLSCIGIMILLFLSLSLGIIEWDPKIPTILFVWLITNLLFVAIPEEALLRGFLQRELCAWFGDGLLAQIGSVVVASLIFTLFHVYWVANLPFLLLVFVAGLIYGGIYQWTKSIESSILCHYLVNAFHFIFFTYPALQTIAG